MRLSDRFAHAQPLTVCVTLMSSGKPAQWLDPCCTLCGCKQRTGYRIGTATVTVKPSLLKASWAAAAARTERATA